MPYLVFVVTCGVPLFFLETVIGQYTQQGAITTWHNLCPLASGKQVRTSLSRWESLKGTKIQSNIFFEMNVNSVRRVISGSLCLTGQEYINMNDTQTVPELTVVGMLGRS